MKSRRPIILALASFLAILTSALLLIFYPTKNIQSAWLDSYEESAKTSLEATVLIGEVGYGGFIHHFKNYVLRREEPLLREAERSIEKSLLAIGALRDHLTDDSILQPIEATVRKYQEMTQWVIDNEEIASDLSVMQLDEIVRVDDTEALNAISSLLVDIERLSVSVKNETNDLLDNFSLHFFIWLTAISILFWAIVAYFLREQRLSSSQTVLLKAINDVTPLAMVTIDASGSVVSANQKFKELFLIAKEVDVTDFKIEDFIPEDVRHKHIGHREKFIASQRTSAMEDRNSIFRALKSNGEIFSANISIANISREKKAGVLVIIKDRTEEELLAQEAYTDYLTRSHNRRYAEKKLEEAMYRRNRYDERLSIMLIDIDNFKTINDQMGHTSGDEVLMNVVKTLESNLRSSDTFARWGGDEFIVYLPATSNLGAKEIAEKFLCLVRSNYVDHQIKVTISIGIAEAQKNQSAEDLLKLADSALYLAKENGRDQFAIVERAAGVGTLG